MPRTLVRVGSEIPLLDLRSFDRRGPDGRLHLSPAFLEQIVRTASRAPEVMVKVSGGANSTRGAIAHLKYIDRQGKLEIETDEGQRLEGKGIEAALVADWDLEALRADARGPYRRTAGRRPAKLVHNVILSMPKGTSPEKVLSASRDFAREQLDLKHRYALVLHTDQVHPHVHLVIKAAADTGPGRSGLAKALAGIRNNVRTPLASTVCAHSLRRLPRVDGTIDLLGMLDLGHTQIMRGLKIEP